MRKNTTTATVAAIAALTENFAPQSWNNETPSTANVAIRPPPTLCPTFQKETTRPRSFVLNQCTIVLPHGGQPIPCTQPFAICTMITSISEPYIALNRPDAAMSAHDRSRPSGRKYFGLLRSETDPMRNFEMPYEIEVPVSAQPRSAFVYCGCSARMSGIASARLLRTR